jgi:hypothetical protein
MKLSKFDIGAEVISILTKGIYPNPKDALREYIQNGVDAQGKNLQVKVRQESIIIKDDGKGMNHDVLRNAVRVGISDKNPAENVGFMGIGIYSSFHLCEKLTIYSRGTKNIPNKLEMDFGKMKSILENQKEGRLNGTIKTEELIDLQTILEDCVSLTENGELSDETYPNQGTTVELTKIEPEFYTVLSNFDEVAEYLKNVIPLHFDRGRFEYAGEIEAEISRLCEKKKQKFELINLSLQVNSKIENLYRPYKNIDFNKDVVPQKPFFFPIERNNVFFGVAWGCLSSARKKLDNKSLRGFVLKKQGFSIGDREGLMKFFPKGSTFFDRYSGEVIIVNPKILPNASRNDIEYSHLRSLFYDVLTEIANKFDVEGQKYQEISKGDTELVKSLNEFKKELGAYNEYEEDSEKLVDKIVILKRIYTEIYGRIKRHGFKEESELKAKELLTNVENLEKTIQARIKVVTKNKKRRSKTISKTEIAKNTSKIEVSKSLEEIKNYDSLYDLLIDIDIKIDEDLTNIIHLIDEMFIQSVAQSKADYYRLLQQFKERSQDNE